MAGLHFQPWDGQFQQLLLPLQVKANCGLPSNTLIATHPCMVIPLSHQKRSCHYAHEILLEHYSNVLTDNVYVNYFVIVLLYFSVAFTIEFIHPSLSQNCILREGINDFKNLIPRTSHLDSGSSVWNGTDEQRLMQQNNC